MSVAYEIWLSNQFGRRIKLIEKYAKLSCTRVTNEIGALSLTVSPQYDDYLAKDNIIEVWRKPEGGALSLFNAYFVRKWDLTEAANVETTTITAVDGTYLLDSRIVAYDAGSTSTSMTGTADDLMKTVVSENCATGATDTDRDLSTYFTIAANQSAGETITMGFAYRNVLRVMQDMANASREAGTRVYFDVMPTFTDAGNISWHFATYINQPGLDRTGANQMIFGTSWGNMTNPQLTYDYIDERAVVYSCGSGIESVRIVEEVEDTTRSGSSFWARREAAYNSAGQASDTDSVYTAGYFELAALRERVRMQAYLKDGPSSKFGLHWNYGDKVVITYRGRQFDAVITSVQLTLYGNGDETVTGRFEVV